MELLWLAAKAFFIALILTPIIRDISRSFNMVDRPGQRKVHVHPIPRVGGVAIAIAYALSLISIAGVDRPWSTGLGPGKVIPGAAIAFLVGLLDDLLSLKPIVKLGGLVLAACVAIQSGLHVGAVFNSPLPVWIDYPLTVFWLVLASNALNLIDGLDGLCAGMGLLSTLTLFTAALLHHNWPLAYATFPLAGALLGFLCYNFFPATVFLGDSGALLIGFLLGSYGMFWTQKTFTLLSMIVPLLALSIPLLDVSLSVLRRLIGRKPLFVGDRGHIHHRLLDQGLSPRQAVWVLYLVGGLGAAFALLASSKIGGKYEGAIMVLFCASAWFGIRKLRYSEFDLGGRLLLDPFVKRTADTKATLESAVASLEGASDEEAWWQGLVREGKQLGFTKLRWTNAGRVREELLKPGAPEGWKLEIPLTEASSVQVEGVFGAAVASEDLIGLAEILKRTFPARERRPDEVRPANAGAA
ncbi:MAG TPA: MraY family glycosyltransferase [Bryobacteraceae bacterium]|nr:MraY family glycosyltransferase [Bryobacteraceae bacterium]